MVTVRWMAGTGTDGCLIWACTPFVVVRQSPGRLSVSFNLFFFFFFTGDAREKEREAAGGMRRRGDLCIKARK